jgi:cytochrome b subunit of formate dehydrogenase
MTKATYFTGRTTITRVLIILLLSISFTDAQGIDCAECHEDVTFLSSAHPDFACIDCHTNITTEHKDEDLAPLTEVESCGECHNQVHRDVRRSIHGDEATCNDCHGDPHEIHEISEFASAVSPVNQIKTCGGCHDTPTSLVDAYLMGVHGKALLLSGLVDAPSCSDCHGDHGILEVENDRAPTSHANSPEMCGACHSLLLNGWKTNSAHGQAWREGRDDSPVCTDCHGSHEIADPITAASRLASAGNCGKCHAQYLTTYRDSFHGKANDLGFVSGANCADCHTPHKNLPAEHPQSSVNQANLMETCSVCHEGITKSFVSFEPHNDPSDPNDNYSVYLIWLFMIGLMIAVFGLFGVHDVLWLQRSLVGVMRDEYRDEIDRSGQYVRRFSNLNTRLHIIIVVTFLLLALTGLPLKFHHTAWAQLLMNLLGGVDSSRLIHRVAAIGTFGYAAFHLVHIFVRWAIRREHGLFWGANSMVPQPKDFSDLFSNLRYFLYMDKRSLSDRWTYIEKFDYLAVVWGVMITGLSGLMLWLPTLFTRFLPGWSVNAAYVVHSDEALLATGFIFVFHFFHTHLRPESFPMDVVIFTGKLSLERFMIERPLEYQRLVDNNELYEYLVDPPTQTERRAAYFWGAVFLVSGVALAVGIIWALLTH